MTDLEAVITASERTLEELEDRNNHYHAGKIHGPGINAALIISIERERIFLAHLRALQRGIYG